MRTASACPPSAAQWRGVRPLRSRVLLGTVFVYSSISKVVVAPSAAAQVRGVHPALSTSRSVSPALCWKVGWEKCLLIETDSVWENQHTYTTGTQHNRYTTHTQQVQNIPATTDRSTSHYPPPPHNAQQHTPSHPHSQQGTPLEAAIPHTVHTGPSLYHHDHATTSCLVPHDARGSPHPVHRPCLLCTPWKGERGAGTGGPVGRPRGGGWGWGGRRVGGGWCRGGW